MAVVGETEPDEQVGGAELTELVVAEISAVGAAAAVAHGLRLHTHSRRHAVSSLPSGTHRTPSLASLQTTRSQRGCQPIRACVHRSASPPAEAAGPCTAAEPVAETLVTVHWATERVTMVVAPMASR